MTVKNWTRKCRELAAVGGEPLRCSIAGAGTAYASGVTWSMPGGKTNTYYAAGSRDNETLAMDRAEALFKTAKDATVQVALQYDREGDNNPTVIAYRRAKLVGDDE